MKTTTAPDLSFDLFSEDEGPPFATGRRCDQGLNEWALFGEIKGEPVKAYFLFSDEEAALPEEALPCDKAHLIKIVIAPDSYDGSEFPPHDADRTAMTDDYADEHSLSNGRRAQDARNKIVHGAEGWEREDYSDLICNMLHLAHSRGIDPNEVIESAMDNFRAEAGAL